MKIGDCVRVNSEKHQVFNKLQGVILPREKMKGHILSIRPEPWFFIQFTDGTYMVWEESELEQIKEPALCKEVKRLQQIFDGAHYLGNK